MKGLPRVFNEILGRYIDVPEKPQRIISFSPAITESLFMLGMGDSVAAVSAFCVRPEEAKRKRKIGSYNTAREDLLDSLSPDLIFTITGYQRDFALKLSERYCVYPIELPVSVAGILDLIVKVGLVLGKEGEARRIVGELLGKLTSAPKSPKNVSVYIEIDFGEPVSFGAISYITDAIEFLGCTNIYGSIRSEWLRPDFEYVKRREPDVFIYEPKMFSEFSYSDLLSLIEKRSFSSLKFAKAGNFFMTPRPYDFLAHHGPSFILEAVPWLSKVLNEAGTRLA